MPVAGIRAYFRIRSGRRLPSKNRRYIAMIVLQLLTLLLTLGVAQENQWTLFGPHWPAWWVWAIAALYLALLGMRLNAAWGRISVERKQRARLLLPQRTTELYYWLPISVLAGLSEECAFRGAVYLALCDITGSAALSILVCVLSFAIAHMVQGWRGVLGTGIIGLAMHGIVFSTHGLYLAIVLHAGYDVMIGLIALQHFLRESPTAIIQPQAAG